MPGGYKVRLPDGSEIGNMALDSVREWYSQGLLNKDSPILTPGSRNWQPLARAVDLKGLKTSSSGRSTRNGRGAAAVEDEDEEPASSSVFFEGDQAWRTVLAAVLCFGGAALGAFLMWKPDQWIVALDQAPWKEIALAHAALGLVLVKGWNFGRKLGRLVVMLAAVALFPLAGILVAQGLRGRALVVLACAAVVLWGMVGLLARGPLSLLGSILSVALVLGGWLGIWAFGVVPDSPHVREIRALSAAERQVVNAGLGLRFLLPPGWLLLRPEQAIVPVPANTIAVAAQPRLGGFAFLVAEAAPRGVLTADEYLQRFLAGRQPLLPGYQEVGRADAVLGALLGRTVEGRWDSGSGPVRDVIVAAKDGWSCIALEGWLPEDDNARAVLELKALQQGLALDGTNAANLSQAVERALRAIPQLSASAAEIVMGSSSARVLEPQDAFRRAYELASRGVQRLDPAEAQELTELIAAGAASIQRSGRTGLTDYFQRVRDGRMTTREEDQAMCDLLREGLLRLPAQRLARLKDLYEKAIRAAVAS